MAEQVTVEVNVKNVMEHIHTQDKLLYLVWIVKSEGFQYPCQSYSSLNPKPFLILIPIPVPDPFLTPLDGRYAI